MEQTTSDPDPSGSLAPRRREWKRALRAIYRLARNTEDTTQVFEIIHGLSGDNVEDNYRRFLAAPHGPRLMRDKPSLNVLLEDREALAHMPDGSLGRAYLTFMIEGELTADGLVDAHMDAGERDVDIRDLGADRLYIGERLIQQHDLWHVLTGYGRDDTGELANLWFSYGQFSQLGMGFIAFLGTLDGPKNGRWWRYMTAAYLRGRSAKFLAAEPMEGLLEKPVDDARRALGISLPLEAHPRGIRTGNRREAGIGVCPARVAA